MSSESLSCDLVLKVFRLRTRTDTGDNTSISKTAVIAGTVGGFVGGVSFVVLAFFLLCRRRKQRDGGSTKAPQYNDLFPLSSRKAGQEAPPAYQPSV